MRGVRKFNRVGGIMAGASVGLHEDAGRLSGDVLDLHRALTSLQEELEAVDWYQQRAQGASDARLKDVLLHNMAEEVEHACMLLEWVRRHSPVFARQMEHYLFTQGAITGKELPPE